VDELQPRAEDLGSRAVAGPVVAYVHDLSTGEVSVMVGEREVTVVDHALANRIARVLGMGA
jgi:hypothetical protein